MQLVVKVINYLTPSSFIPYSLGNPDISIQSFGQPIVTGMAWCVVSVQLSAQDVWDNNTNGT
jgi:hypothetical protein